MKPVLIKQNIKDGIVVKKLSGSSKDLVENEVLINDDFLKSNLHEIFFGDVRIFSVNHEIKREKVFHPSGRYPSIQMHFVFQGEHSIKSNRTGESFSFNNQHNLVHFPHTEIDSKMKGEKIFLLGIQFTKDFFYGFIDQNSKLLSKLWEEIENNKEAMLVSKKNLSITPKIKSILSDIINSKHEGHFRKLYLEAKIIELFVNQFEQANSLSDFNFSRIKRDDKEKLFAVKDILEKNTFTNFSLIGLAREVGLNDYKLKKGFKELFGNTVFGYLSDLKMHEAKRMLLDEKKNIFEVSDILGYSESHHFSAAFKRRFGYLPSKLRS